MNQDADYADWDTCPDVEDEDIADKVKQAINQESSK